MDHISLIFVATGNIILYPSYFVLEIGLMKSVLFKIIQPLVKPFSEPYINTVCSTSVAGK
jgi:hypothetical protein